MAVKSRVVAIKGEEVNQLPLITEEGARATNKSVSRVIKPTTGASQRAKSKQNHMAVTPPPVAPIKTEEIDQLSLIIEEGARATDKSVSRFIEPTTGALQRAKSKQHHIVFGRRGSGKSSLLKKAASDLVNNPISYIDLESYKAHYHPDVIISVLITAFENYRTWIEKTIQQEPEETKPNIISKIFKKKESHKTTAKDELLNELNTFIDDLKKQLSLTDEMTQEKTYNSESELSTSGEIQANLGYPPVGGFNSKAKGDNRVSEKSGVKEVVKLSKIDFLLKRIDGYRNFFRKLAKISQNDAYLFLDDLYHIRRSDQAKLLDYFHRIAKGNSLWLKIGTIKHRSQWYTHGDPPIGIKLGDDAYDIDLDFTLEKYATTKDFLLKILDGFINESKAPVRSEFIVDGAIDRLVLASGGVARDFLGLFRVSIEKTKERLMRTKDHYRGVRIGSEDVNLAVGEYRVNKQEEFQREIAEEELSLKNQFQSVSKFCLEKANANCFLLDQDAQGDYINRINELVDLRLLHLVRSRITVSKKPGKIFKAYMLDVSEYAGERKRRDLKLIEFWKTGAEEQLRLVSLIYSQENMQVPDHNH